MEQNEILGALGRRIRRIRNEKGYTLERVATMSGLGKSNLSRIETGKTNPSYLTLIAIARVLNTDARDFFEDRRILLTVNYRHHI